MNKIGSKHLVLLIVIISFLIRALNSNFGSPILYTVPDEVLNYMAALTMLKDKTLLTTSQYTPFGSYVQLPFLLLGFVVMRLTHQVDSVNDFLLFLTTHEGFFLFIPRIVSAIFGTASLVIVYKITRFIFPKRKEVALWALMFIGFSITHLQISSLGKPNMPALFFFCAGVFYLIKSLHLQKECLKRQILSLVFFSLGGGFHFSSFFGVILFFLTYFVFYRKSPLFHKRNKVSLVLLIIPFGFLLCYSFLSTGNYRPTFTETLGVLQYNVAWGLHHITFFYLKELILTEPVLTLLLGLSFFRFRQWPKIFSPLIIFSLLFAIYIIASFYHSLRYFLPILVIWSLIAASTLEHLLRKISVGKQVIRVGLVLSLILPAGLWVYRYTTPPTFIVAKSWIEKTIPPQTLIASTAIRFSAFVPDKTTLSWIRLYKPDLYTQAYTYIPEKSQIDNVRAIVYLDQIINVKDMSEIIAFVHKHKVKYLIQSYWDPHERIVQAQPHLFRLTHRFSPLWASPERVVKNVLHGSGDIYELLRIHRFGPYIDVLEVQS